MKKYFGLIVIALASHVANAEDTIPQEFLGKWIPKSQSCRSTSGTAVIIGADSIEILDTQSKTIYQGVDICNSCEGGSKYSGIVLWVTPKDKSPFPFILYLNAHEKSGAAELEVVDEEIAKKFSAPATALQKCSRPN